MPFPLVAKSDKKFKRRCVECGGYFPKSSLKKVQVDGHLINATDDTTLVHARSAYVCSTVVCLEAAMTSKGKHVQRALKHSVPKHFFKELERQLSELVSPVSPSTKQNDERGAFAHERKN
jgi:predicted RNA-binding protein YlxR (DUF448 family)